jgi:type IV pilus assembly protein PilM
MNWEWWKRFTKLFRPRITTLVGIDFGHGEVKVAEVSLVDGKPYLRTLAIVETPSVFQCVETNNIEEQGLTIDPEVLKEMLTRALSLNGVKAKNAVLAVGGQLSFMREVTFPKLPPEELAEAIKWDIPKYVPYESDSYEFDYAITGQDTSTGDLRVLIVASPKEVVHQLTQVVRDVGLTPLAVDIESMAVYRTLTGAENSMVLDVGSASTQISLFQKGYPVFNRIVQGRRFIAKVEEEEAAAAELEAMVDELVQEVRRTAQFFTQQNKRMTIDKVVVTGAIELDKIVNLLRAKVDLPVVGHNPLAGLAMNPSIAANYAQRFGPQLAVAVGLAMRGDEL